MDNHEKRKAIRRKSKKHAVVMLGITAFAIWLVILLIKVLLAHSNGESIDFFSILDSIGDNVLGVLPPLIFIDLVFEFITQDYVSEEISEQITGTLMSNPETIQLFDDATKRSFLNATIDSLITHGQDEAEMAENAIAPYLQGRYNLKKHFTYNITLRESPISSLFDSPEYMTVNETLSYEKHFIASEPLGETFSVGFFTCNSDLDKNLREHTFLFREGLTILPEDLDKLCAMTDEEKLRFVTNDMCLKVYVGHNRCDVTGVSITDHGIAVALHTQEPPANNKAFIEITFCMPWLKTEKAFLVSITEPTYSVKVRFDYPRNVYNVDIYPFFNDAEDALVEDADRGVGSCDINLRDKWVYPMSGIVFSLESKNQ